MEAKGRSSVPYLAILVMAVSFVFAWQTDARAQPDALPDLGCTSTETYIPDAQETWGATSRTARAAKQADWLD